MALNQYGTDPILAAFQGSITGGTTLVRQTHYNGTFAYTSANASILLTLNTGVSKKSAAVSLQQFGSGFGECDITYPEDAPISPVLASNQIRLLWPDGAPTQFAIVVLNCNNVTS